MEDPGARPAESLAWACPHCGAHVNAAPASSGGEMQCPNCGGVFSAAANGASAAAAKAPELMDYAPPATPSDRHGDAAQELDGLRIRQVLTLRRGAARARSYLVVATAGSAVAAVKLVLMTVAHVRARGWGAMPVGYLLFVGVLLMLAGYLGRRALELHRELQVPAPLPPPPAEPDFSTLSDGSQRWKNLEDLG